MFCLPLPPACVFSAEEKCAGQLLAEALRRSGVTPKEAAHAMDMDVSLLSRWVSGERPVSLPKLLRLPPAALEEFGELLGQEIGIVVLTRDAIACFARLLHHRPRPVRAKETGQADYREERISA